MFIEDEHYTRLKGVFDEFEQFLVGKENLVELRNTPGISDDELMYRTRDIVEANRWHREHFTETLSEYVVILRNICVAQMKLHKNA